MKYLLVLLTTALFACSSTEADTAPDSCPLVDGGCGSNCQPVVVQWIDVARKCVSSVETIECAPLALEPGQANCHVDDATGRLFATSGAEPQSIRTRPCTAAEYTTFVAAGTNCTR